MARFCPDCGTPHDCTAESGVNKTQVEIVRLETNRDIEVARLNARAATTIAETDAENSSEHAEGLAEGMETAIDALSGGSAPEDDGGAPIVVDMPDEPEPEPAEEPDNAPPVVEVSAPAETKRGGYWSNYR